MPTNEFQKRAAQVRHQDTQIRAQDIVDTLRESLLILDEDLHVVSTNRSFYGTFRVSREETIGRFIFDLGNGQWNIPQLRHLLEKIIPHDTIFDNFEVRHRFETIGEKTMLLNARRIVRESGQSPLILLAIEDVTEKTAALAKIEASEANYRKFVEGLNSIIIGFNRKGTITFFNRFAESLFGYHRDKVIGKPFIGTIIPRIDRIKGFIRKKSLAAWESDSRLWNGL